MSVQSGKLASLGSGRHKRGMRRLMPFAVLLASACATTPPQQPAKPTVATPVAHSRHDHSTLSGMTANELAEHFGKPKLQVREGDGTKLQFAGTNCVLDAYLYPPPGGQGVPRVVHVDARNFQGVDVNTQSCIASIEGQ